MGRYGVSPFEEMKENAVEGCRRGKAFSAKRNWLETRMLRQCRI